MIKAILVDSDQASLRNLRNLIRQHADDIAISSECSNIRNAAAAIASHEPDLVFLDVTSSFNNGFDLLNEMESIHFEIVFLTASSEFSLDAFRYGAADCLLKPVKEEFLISAVEKVRERWKNKVINQNIPTVLQSIRRASIRQEMKLCLPSARGFQVVKLDDIVYCEAETSYTIFHLINGKRVMVSKPIIEYEALLQNTSFCRVHKSFMINMSHIKEYVRGEGGTVMLSNSREVEVSRRKKDVFISKLKEMYRY